jgi:RNA polymerase sigma factor (sigma-70 family)
MGESAVRTPVEALVAAAARGDEDAWAAIVDRYAPLVWGVVRQFRLEQADAADVNQTVWLRLVENLRLLREPAALPGWIARTTRNECLRVLRVGHRTAPFDPLDATPVQPFAGAGSGDPAVDDRLLRAERQQAVREALADLPERCRFLFGLLLREPALSYEEIARRMGVPVGSVGPTRARCLDRLRRNPALAPHLDLAMATDRGGEARHGAAAGR